MNNFLHTITFFIDKWTGLRSGHLFRKIGLICYCGSGMHPRRCKKHPWAYQQHIFELNYGILSDNVDELEERIEKLETRR